VLMPSSTPTSASISTSATPGFPVVSATPKTAATATEPSHPPLVRLDLRPVASLRGQGGKDKQSKSTSVAMCQTPGSWLLYDAARRSMRRQPHQQQSPVQQPPSPPSPVQRLFVSPKVRDSPPHPGLRRNPIRPPKRPPPPRPVRPVCPAQQDSAASSEYESASESPAVPPVQAPGSAPVDHNKVMQQVQERRLVSAQQSSKILLRSYFNIWRAHSRHNSTAAFSRSPATWRTERTRGGRRQHTQQRRHHTTETPMHNQRTPTHTNKDFPFFNVRGACISCGDGWLLGYWRRQPKYGYRGARAFDPLEDKLMCDACRHDHPLGPYYFPDYYSYVTDDAIQRVQAEADGACPADAAKQLAVQVTAAACIRQFVR
jgi:hypothetical protein